MLSEIRNPRQIPAEGHRRWFADKHFDLIVWYERAGGPVAGFQLCYDKTASERALTWRAGQGCRHERVDDGEGPGSFKMSPVLLPDGALDARGVAERFRRAAERIDPQIRDLVLEKLAACGRGRPADDRP